MHIAFVAAVVAAVVAVTYILALIDSVSTLLESLLRRFADML